MVVAPDKPVIAPLFVTSPPVVRVDASSVAWVSFVNAPAPFTSTAPACTVPEPLFAKPALLPSAPTVIFAGCPASDPIEPLFVSAPVTTSVAVVPVKSVVDSSPVVRLPPIIDAPDKPVIAPLFVTSPPVVRVAVSSVAWASFVSAPSPFTSREVVLMSPWFLKFAPDDSLSPTVTDCNLPSAPRLPELTLSTPFTAKAFSPVMSPPFVKSPPAVSVASLPSKLTDPSFLKNPFVSSVLSPVITAPCAPGFAPFSTLSAESTPSSLNTSLPVFFTAPPILTASSPEMVPLLFTVLPADDSPLVEIFFVSIEPSLVIVWLAPIATSLSPFISPLFVTEPSETSLALVPPVKSMTPVASFTRAPPEQTVTVSARIVPAAPPSVAAPLVSVAPLSMITCVSLASSVFLMSPVLLEVPPASSRILTPVMLFVFSSPCPTVRLALVLVALKAIEPSLRTEPSVTNLSSPASVPVFFNVDLVAPAISAVVVVPAFSSVV